MQIISPWPIQTKTFVEICPHLYKTQYRSQTDYSRLTIKNSPSLVCVWAGHCDTQAKIRLLPHTLCLSSLYPLHFTPPSSPVLSLYLTQLPASTVTPPLPHTAPPPWTQCSSTPRLSCLVIRNTIPHHTSPYLFLSALTLSSHLLYLLQSGSSGVNASSWTLWPHLRNIWTTDILYRIMQCLCVLTQWSVDYFLLGDYNIKRLAAQLLLLRISHWI